jgi:hypothetical protein
MNKDNFSAFVIAIGVVSLIVGFAVYFNSPELNKAVSGQGRGTTNFVPAIQVVQEGNDDNIDTTTTTIKKTQFSIDKSQFSGVII